MAIGMYIPGTPSGQLPHPPISTAVIQIVEQAITKAWELIVTNPRPGFDLANAIEDKRTHELHKVLCDIVRKPGLVEGFDLAVFGGIVRGPDVASYNERSIKKQPDLLVLFAVNSRECMLPHQDGVFIECKPVDTQHPLKAHYYKKGIVRFIRGEYAWAMTSALMIGYCKPKFRLDPNLKDVLIKSRGGSTSTPTLIQCRLSRGSSLADVVHISRHDRPFKYIQTGKAAPPIEIRHLWLRRQ